VLKETKARFDAFYEDQSSSLLPDDYKGSVFKILLKSEEHKKDTFAKLVEVMKKPSTSQPHKTSIFRSLGQVDDLGLKREVLEMTLLPYDQSGIKTQDFMYPMVGVAASSK